MNENISSFPSTTKEFTFEHLDLGLAAALGNAFRRLLLTRVPGWAIFAVKISDKEKTIASEFEKLKGVTEIPLYLIFNLKKLVFQSPQKDLQEKGANSPTFSLQINIDNSQSKESYVVTGKDIQGELKVINPEVYLATLEEGSQLKIDLHCRYH
jgi:DNA-directed RNA polymerase subunit alpha